MPLDLDPRFTFDSYVVGTSNRLAAAAARRVADAPGSAYNPLFLYSASGLGKTHLIMAVGHHIRRVHADVVVVYDTLENLMEGVMAAIRAGERDAFRLRLPDASVLLLDDVQFLAGHRGAQEELLRAWDSLSARRGQIVLASDRPPQEIDGLDDRLLSRFSGGLIADLDVPDYETRVAIVRRKAEERNQRLSDGVAERLAKVAFANVRELQGGLNRVLAVQELDGREVAADQLEALLDLPAERRSIDEFSSFLDEIADVVGDVVATVTPEHRLGEAILRWEGEGFRTRQLEAGLGVVSTPEEADALIGRYEAAVQRLSELTDMIRSLDEGAAELARLDVLRNPERLDDAEALLEQVQERVRPLPGPRPAPDFDTLPLASGLFAVRAARAVAEQPGERYNPLFIHAPAGTGKTALVNALALEFAARHGGEGAAVISGADFSAELIRALERNQVDAWRARYRRAKLLVVDGVDALMGTERAQEELFHLFDLARRSGVQLVFTAVLPPRELGGFEDRLRSRLESGLVVDLASAGEEAEPEATSTEDATVAAPEPPGGPDVDAFFLDREKLLWQWPYLQDSMAQEND